MKKLFKWLFRLALYAVLLIAAILLLRNIIAEALLERRLHTETGMEVSIGRVHIGITEPTLTLYDLRMYNPDEFGRSSCLDVPELHLEYNLSALLDKRIQLKLVRLDLAELNIVQNENGRFNLELLQLRRDGSSTTARSRPFEVQEIATLNLALGRFKYTNLKNPSENDELYAGVRNQIVRQVKTIQDLEPLLTRIALERNAKHFFDRCFNRAAGREQTNAPSAAKSPAPKNNTPDPAPGRGP
jgi:uncharacterized protein involved in outer membrane biogenesis